MTAAPDRHARTMLPIPDRPAHGLTGGSAADELRGPQDCVVSGYGTVVGVHPLTARAYGNAGTRENRYSRQQRHSEPCRASTTPST
jgi:hypothetical protein